MAVQPRRLSYGQLSKRAEVARELKITVSEPDKVKITGVKLDDDHFELKLTDGEPTGDSTYDVLFKGAEELGRIKANVRITFSGSDVEHIDVPLWGQIVGDLRYPNQIFFHKDKGGFKERKVNFTSRTGVDVHMLEAKDPDGHLKIEVLKTKGKMAEIKLEVAKPDADEAKPLKGKIQVKTTDKDQPKLEIPYTIHFRRGRLGSPLSARGIPPSVRRGPSSLKTPAKKK